MVDVAGPGMGPGARALGSSLALRGNELRNYESGRAGRARLLCVDCMPAAVMVAVSLPSSWRIHHDPWASASLGLDGPDGVQGSIILRSSCWPTTAGLGISSINHQSRNHRYWKHSRLMKKMRACASWTSSSSFSSWLSCSFCLFSAWPSWRSSSSTYFPSSSSLPPPLPPPAPRSPCLAWVVPFRLRSSPDPRHRHPQRVTLSPHRAAPRAMSSGGGSGRNERGGGGANSGGLSPGSRAFTTSDFSSTSHL